MLYCSDCEDMVRPVQMDDGLRCPQCGSGRLIDLEARRAEGGVEWDTLKADLGLNETE